MDGACCRIIGLENRLPVGQVGAVKSGANCLISARADLRAAPSTYQRNRLRDLGTRDPPPDQPAHGWSTDDCQEGCEQHGDQDRPGDRHAGHDHHERGQRDQNSQDFRDTGRRGHGGVPGWPVCDCDGRDRS